MWLGLGAVGLLNKIILKTKPLVVQSNQVWKLSYLRISVHCVTSFLREVRGR